MRADNAASIYGYSVSYAFVASDNVTSSDRRCNASDRIDDIYMRNARDMRADEIGSHRICSLQICGIGWIWITDTHPDLRRWIVAVMPRARNVQRTVSVWYLDIGMMDRYGGQHSMTGTARSELSPIGSVGSVVDSCIGTVWYTPRARARLPRAPSDTVARARLRARARSCPGTVRIVVQSSESDIRCVAQFAPGARAEFRQLRVAEIG